VLVAPPDLVIEPKARDRCTVGVELDPLGSGEVVTQVLWKRHFHTGNQIDDHSYLLSLGGMGRREHCANHEHTREPESSDFLGHDRSFLERAEPTHGVRDHGDAHVW